ncbi:hypothetical protein TcasGA2_TC009197 [Tribolium castaneum]|uniref:Uncharacterized protein n=1 Tax=Tribolium castaneum TaxID=7070 RepID=D6WSZ9_TRICA|nr:hypothetical protein TcasGA2_TC009197 [Tribolium castaneum]
MQRILSVETSRSSNVTSEYVTKRLCCSFILTVAFFAVVGGFFLGRFATEKTLQKLRYELIEVSKKLTMLDQNLKNTFQDNANCSRRINCEHLSNFSRETTAKSVQQVLDVLNQCFHDG